MTSHRGFSAPELLIAVALFTTITGMSVALVSSAVPSIRSDGQVDRLVGMLQVARETAITRQRNIELRFDEQANIVRLIRHDDGVEVLTQEVAFEYGVRLYKSADTDDTPEQNGDAGPVNFGGALSMTFVPDGSFVAQDGVPLNGTIFMGIEHRLDAARAVVLTGTTARVRVYRWSGPAGAAGDWVTR